MEILHSSDVFSVRKAKRYRVMSKRYCAGCIKVSASSRETTHLAPLQTNILKIFSVLFFSPEIEGIN